VKINSADEIYEYHYPRKTNYFPNDHRYYRGENDPFYLPTSRYYRDEYHPDFRDQQYYYIPQKVHPPQYYKPVVDFSPNYIQKPLSQYNYHPIDRNPEYVVENPVLLSPSIHNRNHYVRDYCTHMKQVDSMYNSKAYEPHYRSPPRLNTKKIQVQIPNVK